MSLPLVPLEPSEPLDPLDPDVPLVPAVPEVPLVPDVIAANETPSIIRLPLEIFTDPEINKLPVNSCVSSCVSPNLVLPL